MNALRVHLHGDQPRCPGQQPDDADRGVATVRPQFQRVGWRRFHDDGVQDGPLGAKRRVIIETHRLTGVVIRQCVFLCVCTFLIPHVHGPLSVFTEVIDGCDDALWISSDCVYTDGPQEALRHGQVLNCQSVDRRAIC